MNSAVTVVPHIEHFAKYLEGLREYEKFFKATIGILDSTWDLRWYQRPLTPVDKLRRNELINDREHGAFLKPMRFGTLDFTVDCALPDTAQPFGATNNVALGLELYEKQKRIILNDLNKLYGPCKPRWERLVATMVEYGTKIEMPPKDLLMCNCEEDLRVWWNENNEEHTNLLTIILDKVNNNHNKFYDIRHGKRFRFGSNRHFVLFNGIESLLGFLVYHTADKWNELGRSMAYHAAVARAGIPCGKEADYVPEGSDILKVMEQIKGLFVVPKRYDPTNTTLSGFFASTEIKMTLTERYSFHIPFGFLSTTHGPVATRTVIRRNETDPYDVELHGLMFRPYDVELHGLMTEHQYTEAIENLMFLMMHQRVR
mmetsp:Transcript_15106/g.37241  ORF Transcript_15106/g.37241 Transcript_15106/m.37241 type:complete len:371 (-) Transcript_15106:461-1573(-)|eukprot:CAMPEP_0113480328 /NCGR_PEP_ID=MMETSP0014_2-20120614/21816_1 /TAXON_ID=2857 /ORGANISM="Nitzschia sp." /LENGTH=370 /DNA_ID=CAMNT_0000373749 /DNA_START=57 /DNA_END=1169 /DNA_ORIENTATION=+ /assembly_acc=CAM_ASM_000159